MAFTIALGEIGGALLVLSTPIITEHIVNDGLVKRNSSAIRDYSLLLVSVFGLNAALNYLLAVIGAAVDLRFQERLRLKIVEYFMTLDYRVRELLETNAIAARIVHDVPVLGGVFTGTFLQLPALLMRVILTIYICFRFSVSFGLLSAISAVLFMGFSVFWTRPIEKRVSADMAARTELLQQVSSGLTEEGAYLGVNLPEVVQRRWLAVFGEQRRVQLRLTNTRQMFLLSLSATSSIATALVFVVVGTTHLATELSVGATLAVSSLVAGLFGPIMEAAQFQSELASLVVSSRRVAEFLKFGAGWTDALPEVSIVDQGIDGRVVVAIEGCTRVGATHVLKTSFPDLVAASDARGSLTLDYGCLSLEGGHVYIVRGPNGSGKSTLCKSILEVSRSDPASLPGGVVYIGSSQLLPFTSARSAFLAWSEHGSGAEVSAACSMLIDTFGMDPDAPLEGLSQGQRQVVQLICGALSNSALLLLDEASNSLSIEWESAVINIVRRFYCARGGCALLVSHRTIPRGPELGSNATSETPTEITVSDIS